MKHMCMKIFGLLLVTVLMLAGVQVASAQVSSSMTGRVEDPSGSAIAGATVTVTNLETAAVRSIAADEGGSYRALSLPVGRYQVKAEKEGFKAAVQTGIDLAVGQQAVVNLKLEVGAVSEQVTVTAEASVVNFTIPLLSVT